MWKQLFRFLSSSWILDRNLFTNAKFMLHIYGNMQVSWILYSFIWNQQGSSSNCILFETNWILCIELLLRSPTDRIVIFHILSVVQWQSQSLLAEVTKPDNACHIKCLIFLGILIFQTSFLSFVTLKKSTTSFILYDF